MCYRCEIKHLNISDVKMTNQAKDEVFLRLQWPLLHVNWLLTGLVSQSTSRHMNCVGVGPFRFLGLPK